MARIINTGTADHGNEVFDLWTRDQIYNGTDVLATRMVLNGLLPQLGPETSATYTLERQLQAPALEMALRGVRIDMALRARLVESLGQTMQRLEAQLRKLVIGSFDLPKWNWRSTRDRQTLFYECLAIRPIRQKGVVTVNRAAREKLAGYTIAKVFVSHLNAMSDIEEKIKKLKSEIDPDERIRSSYNIAGTETGRFSSSFSIYGSGGNLQNIEESLRAMFIADPGMRWCKVDAGQIQSRIVGAIQWKLFGDGTYLDACESTDPHTHIAKLVWPNLGWTGDPAHDRALCDNREKPFYRTHTHRDICKKLGHGSNFGGAASGLARQTGVAMELVAEFQSRYFSAFPGHKRWHLWVEEQLATVGYITGITGRKRWFWGRRNEPDTLRAAIAYDPQNSEAFIVNSAMLRIWRRNLASIMLHEHDGLVYQYPAEAEAEVVPQLLEELERPIDIGRGRAMIIPYEAKVGFNRGEWHASKNPGGLRKCGFTATKAGIVG